MNRRDGVCCMDRSLLAIQKTYACRGEMCLFLLHCVAESVSGSSSTLGTRMMFVPECLWLFIHVGSATSSSRVTAIYLKHFRHTCVTKALSLLYPHSPSLGQGTSSAARQNPDFQNSLKNSWAQLWQPGRDLASTSWEQGKSHASAHHCPYPHPASQQSWPLERGLHKLLCMFMLGTSLYF